MLPLYEENKESIVFLEKKSEHISPHLHKGMEMVYVTKGTLELGIRDNLYHMEKGDFALVFPDVIHHYQVFSEGENEAYYILALPALTEKYVTLLQKKMPKQPVIRADKLHEDISYAIKRLEDTGEGNRTIVQAYINIIVGRCLEFYELVDREDDEKDMVTQIVSYVSQNFKETITLPIMAKELGVSKFVLSRIFSGVFHTNFNQYLNEMRLNYAVALLEYTRQPITDICMNAGFESQRTFNRVFRERFKVTPREYRDRCQKGNDFT